MFYIFEPDCSKNVGTKRRRERIIYSSFEFLMSIMWEYGSWSAVGERAGLGTAPGREAMVFLINIVFFRKKII